MRAMVLAVVHLLISRHPPQTIISNKPNRVDVASSEQKRRRERFYREQRLRELHKKAMLRVTTARDGGGDDGDGGGDRPLDKSNAASPPSSCVEHPFPPTPSTAPSSAERCPVSPASSPPPVFHDLVMILDAPALPPPRRKLPELPEEFDVSTIYLPL